MPFINDENPPMVSLLLFVFRVRNIVSLGDFPALETTRSEKRERPLHRSENFDDIQTTLTSSRVLERI